MDRYQVVPPVTGEQGYPYWNVIDTESREMQNFALAVFSVHLANAAHEAAELCKKLNRLHRPRKERE